MHSSSAAGQSPPSPKWRGAGGEVRPHPTGSTQTSPPVPLTILERGRLCAVESPANQPCCLAIRR